MLHSVAVFVRDDVAIFAIVHPSIAKVNSVVPRRVEGLVCGIPMGMGEGREIPNAIDCPGIIVKPEAVEVALYRVNGVVDGGLFETIIRSVVVVDPRDFVGIGHG